MSHPLEPDPARSGIQKPVALADLVDALDSLTEMASAYLDRETGEVHRLTDDDFSAAEREDGDLADWEHEVVELARAIRDDEAGRYLALPDKHEIHEYRFLEDFAYAYPDEEISEELGEAIRGRGAFRRFKDAVNRLGISEEWYEYRYQRLRDVAKEWCEGEGVPYLETRETEPVEEPG